MDFALRFRLFLIPLLAFVTTLFASSEKQFVTELFRLADVEINGKRVAAVGPDEPYKCLHEPGKVVITTKGGRAEIDAEPNKEYVFEIVLKTSTSAALMFGLIGAQLSAEYPITLKTTRDLQQ